MSADKPSTGAGLAVQETAATSSGASTGAPWWAWTGLGVVVLAGLGYASYRAGKVALRAAPYLGPHLAPNLSPIWLGLAQHQAGQPIVIPGYPEASALAAILGLQRQPPAPPAPMRPGPPAGR